VIPKEALGSIQRELEDIGIAHSAVFLDLQALAKNSRLSGNEPNDL
jgi:hypothetical protein